MHIMHKIFLTGALSPQKITSSMVLSLTGVTRNNPKHPKAALMHKQEQYKQVCYIKTGLEISIDHLITRRNFIKVI